MDEIRRSGVDRRQQDVSTQNERRKVEDQRKLLKNPDQAIERFKKIPMFNGLTMEQLKKMLRICSRKNYKTQEYIYHMGEESKNMFILLKGEISIMFNTGLELQSITPAGAVGEMGIFTGEKRSASVVAVTDCIILNFNKEELFKLFSKDTDLAIKILLNVIRDLSKKLRKDNEKLEELLYRIRSLDLV